MGLFSDIVSVGAPIAGSFFGPAGTAIGSAIGGIAQGIEGRNAAEDATAQQVAATQAAIARQEQAKAEAQGFLQPFGTPGQQGLDQASFLTDPTQQFEFLQSHPLFSTALQNANQQTQQTAAAGGRFSAGDTLQQLSNNVLLSGMPLINQQSKNIAGLLDFGRGVATSQANTAIGSGSSISPLLQDVGASQSAGTIGAFNAFQPAINSAIQAAPSVGSFFNTTGRTVAAPGLPGSIGMGGGIGL